MTNAKINLFNNSNTALTNPFTNKPVKMGASANQNFEPSFLWLNIGVADFYKFDEKKVDFPFVTSVGIPIDNALEKAGKRVANVNSENETYKNMSALSYEECKKLTEEIQAMPEGTSNVKYVLCEIVQDQQGNFSLVPTNLAIQLLHKAQAKQTLDPAEAKKNGYGAPCPFGLKTA